MILKIFGNLFDKRRKLIITLNLKQGDVCIDCGANVGYVTEILVKKGCIVYAFESNPYAFEILNKKFERYSNVYLYRKAVWNRKTTRKLYLHKKSDENNVLWSTASSIKQKKVNINKNNYLNIEIVNLSDFIKRLGEKIKLLKMDIEGSGIEVLNSLIDNDLTKEIDYIFVETHDNKNNFLDKSTDKLRKTIRKSHLGNIYLDWI